MPTSKTRKVIVVVAVAALMAVLSVSSVHAIEYGGFGGTPAYPRSDNPRTQSIFIHAIDPGATQLDAVLVVNNSSERKTLMVYAADSTPSSGGGFACKQLAEDKTDVGAWITLSKSEVTVEPGKNEIVPFTIAAPLDASVGEHNGCILIQEKKATTGQTGATVSVRTGIRVVVTIPGDMIRKLEIVGFTVSPGGLGYILHPLVKNDGNVSIDASVSVDTRNFIGFGHLKQGGQYPILRGATSEWNFEVPKPFWGLWYRSSFTVTYDSNPEAGVGVISGKTLTVLQGPTVWFFTMPAPLSILAYVVGILIIVGIIAWMIFRKRKKKIHHRKAA